MIKLSRVTIIYNKIIIKNSKPIQQIKQIKKEVRKIPGKLPKNAKAGSKHSIMRNVKGKKRKLTYERTRGHGKNKNLKWKLESNKPA